jgi:hypothetical protein
MAKKTTTAKPSSAKGTKPNTKVEQMPLTPELERAFENGIALRLIMGSPGFKAKVDSDEITAGEADTDALHVHKETLECDEYDAIKQLHGEIKKMLWLRSMPIKTKLYRGTYFIKERAIGDVCEKLEAYKKDHDEKLVPAFLAVYEQAKQTAKKKLKNLYDDRDYPTAEALRKAFYIQAFPLENAKISGRLKSVNEKLFTTLAGEMRQQVHDAVTEMRTGLRAMLFQMTQHLHSKLSGSEKKVLRQTAVTHILDFVKYFEDRDMTNDQDLKKVVDQLKKTMDGVEIEQLKKDDKYRDAMVQSLDAVNKQLDGLVTNVGRAVKLPPKKKADKKEEAA